MEKVVAEPTPQVVEVLDQDPAKSAPPVMPPPAPPPGAPAPPIHRRHTTTSFAGPRHFLDKRFIYAVISQRARGLTIGVNMNPDKFCNFDCLYCEVNRDTPAADRKVLVRVLSTELQDLLAMTFQRRLREFPGFQSIPDELLELKDVALSGNGEPTLCPNFSEIVHEVVHIRSLGRYPFFKIVLVTNASGLDVPDVREGLRAFNAQDEIWAKLDAGTEEHLKRMNRTQVPLKKTLANILLTARERPVIIQSLFPLINDQEPLPEEIEQYVQRLLELKDAGAQIAMVQVYSAHRPPHHPDCGHLPLKSLSRIAQQVREVTGLKAEVF